MTQVFVSYKRDVEPDQSLAQTIASALSTSDSVFIDSDIAPGERWADRIERQLEIAQLFVVLVSQHSIASEMVLEEVRTAVGSSRSRQRPLVLPIRVGTLPKLPYELSALLGALQHTTWSGSQDTPVVLESLRKAASTIVAKNSNRTSEPSHLAPWTAAPPFPARSTGAEEQPRPYVERAADRLLAESLQRKGSTVLVKAPRQMGKGLFLQRAVNLAQASGQRVAVIDFQGLGLQYIHEAGAFFDMITDVISYELGLPLVPASTALPPTTRCTRVMERSILPACATEGLLLVFDEVDALFGTPFASNFFSMIRAWHNQRAFKPVWRALSIIVSAVAEPNLFVSDPHQSPFNVGTLVHLTDFKIEETRELNAAYGSPLKESDLQALYALISGHPFLTSQTISRVAAGHFTAEQILTSSPLEQPLFADHLRALSIRLARRPELLGPLAKALRDGQCSHAAQQTLIDEGVLALAINGLRPRYAIYAPFLDTWLRSNDSTPQGDA